MELGKKIKEARLEKGLSQRQLCGEVITRNMLSLIENGAATPSLETLCFLARELDKPMGYFLEEETISSPNQLVMEKARLAWEAGDFKGVLEAMASYRSPDAVYDWEAALLRVLALLEQAEAVLAAGKRPYALELLERARREGENTPYYTPELERRRLLILAQLKAVSLPTDDRELLIRARGALRGEDPVRAGAYLEAAEERQTPQWQYLRGQVWLMQCDYVRARQCFEAAWEHDPVRCAGYLEQCCRELEDYKMAYHYACRLREL